MDESSSAVPSVNSLLTYYTSKPPCCIVRLSRDPPTFAIGCYELDESDKTTNVPDQEHTNSDRRAQQRSGSIELIRFHPTDSQWQATHLTTLNLPFGILDIRTCALSVPPFSSCTGVQNFIAVATSVGTIAIIARDFKDQLLHVLNLRVGEPDEVITQLRFHPEQSHVLGFTSSSGAVKLLRLPEDLFRHAAGAVDGWPRWRPDADGAGRTVELYMRDDCETVAQHSLEAWTLAFPGTDMPPHQDAMYKSDYLTDGHGMWTGGDDAKLSWQPVPVLHGHEDPDLPIPPPWEDPRTHTAGVTAILPVHLFELDQVVLITGSYDDRIRVLRTPDGIKIRRPQVLAEADLGGGVWRFNVLSFARPEDSPDQKYRVRLLVCCMYAGARIVELSGTRADGDWGIEVQTGFTEHESMCYGCESFKVHGRDRSEFMRMMVTCSFCDKRVCVWRAGDTYEDRPRIPNAFGSPGE